MGILLFLKETKSSFTIKRINRKFLVVMILFRLSFHISMLSLYE